MKYFITLLLFACTCSFLLAQLQVESANGRVSIGHLETAMDEIDLKGDIRISPDNLSDRGVLRIYDFEDVKGLELAVVGAFSEARASLKTFNNMNLELDAPTILLSGTTKIDEGKTLQWVNSSGATQSYLQHQGNDMFIQNNNIFGDILLRSGRDIKLMTLDDVNDIYQNTLVIKNDGKIGLGESNPIHTLHIAGDIGLTGGVFGISDRRVKTDIRLIENATDIINQLRPVEYDYKTNEFSHLNLPDNHQYGLIAQEVESVLPSIVAVHGRVNENVSSNELKGLNYEQIIPFLVKALQEQDAEIEKLKATISKF